MYTAGDLICVYTLYTDGENEVLPQRLLGKFRQS
jgi:hypothetical protein